MLPVILAAVGGYLVYDSLKSKKYADGGMMAKGGMIKYFDNKEEWRLSRPSGSIEKEVLEKVKYYSSSDKDFVGNFGWRTASGKLTEGYLYRLDESDKDLVKDVKLKDGEKIYRYFTKTTAVGGITPLIKVNLDKGLLYFSDTNDADKVTFETKGTSSEWVSLIKDKMADGGMMAKGGTTKGGEKYEVLSPDGITIEFDKPYYTSRKKAYEAFDKWKKRYEAQGYYSSNNGRIPLHELENYMTIRELDGGKKKKLPKHLEEKLEIIAKWCDINIEDVIGYLDAMIDSGLTYDDLKINPTKNTRFQRERATEKKIKEIWEKIEPNYKGRLKGNHYYGVIKEIIISGRLYSNDSGDLLKDFKSYRNK
jgi:hypothetical protein